ncbi:MAG: COX aromatic rich motif-containing protein [Alphaproteobacteria bacterium]|nr:COX aromatic rich motif-containing protein [Alphaproteobacteria bacterium]MCB9931440.1 COX aromatic rich motif-containing protein [Alphaproteobacteria bacterium]
MRKTTAPQQCKPQSGGCSTVARHAVPFALLPLLSGCSLAPIPLLNPVGAVGEAEANLFFLSVTVMLIIIVPVMIATLWFAWRYRAANNGRDYDPNFVEHPVINKITVFVPLFTIAILGGLTWVYTHRLDPYRPVVAGAPYEIQAISLDYKWLFVYPDEGVATVNELVAPAGRPVTLRMTADPMMTSIFVPGLISQIYTMPGMESRANFYSKTAAELQGSNAMYSGPGFEYQRFTTRIMPANAFRSWIDDVKSGKGAAGKKEALLDRAAYDRLVQRSTNNPVTHFAAVRPGLFARVVQKYTPQYIMRELPTKAQFDAGHLSGPAAVAADGGRPSPQGGGQ